MERITCIRFMKWIHEWPGQCTDGLGGCQPYAATTAVNTETAKKEAKSRSTSALWSNSPRRICQTALIAMQNCRCRRCARSSEVYAYRCGVMVMVILTHLGAKAHASKGRQSSTAYNSYIWFNPLVGKLLGGHKCPGKSPQDLRMRKNGKVLTLSRMDCESYLGRLRRSRDGGSVAPSGAP